MRSKHKICYAQLGRKFYYRPEEVELVIYSIVSLMSQEF